MSQTRLKILFQMLNQEDELKNSHVLIHPSFREGGSWSIMESMFYGNPVICFDTSGPKDMGTSETGILVDLDNPKKSITITGTNGKTSVTWYLAQICKYNNMPTK